MRRVIYFLVPIICFLITTTFAQSPPPVSFAAVVNYAVGTNPQSVALGDFNGDGRPDLATANLNSNDVSVLLKWGRHLPGGGELRCRHKSFFRSGGRFQ